MKSSGTKKLKQSRLPFKLLPKDPVTTEKRKRKLSLSDDDNPAVKIGRKCDIQENFNNPVCTIVLDNLDKLDNNAIVAKPQKKEEKKPFTMKILPLNPWSLNCDEVVEDSITYVDHIEISDDDGDDDLNLKSEDAESIIIDVDPPPLSSTASTDENPKTVMELIEMSSNKESTLLGTCISDKETISSKTTEYLKDKETVKILSESVVTETEKIKCISEVELVTKNVKIVQEIKSVISKETILEESKIEKSSKPFEVLSDCKLEEVIDTKDDDKTDCANNKRRTSMVSAEASCSDGNSKRPKVIDNKVVISDDDASKLTPKLTSKRIENEKKKEERQKLKEDRDRKIQEEKELKQKERERKIQEEKELKQKDKEDKEKLRKKERDEKEEQKRKEREDKEEQKRKEKEEKEKKRLDEIKQKNDERKKKEIEEETRKKRASDAFTKFFKNRKSDRLNTSEDQQLNGLNTSFTETQNQNFMPFRIKENMKLAPSTRRQLSDNEKLEMENLMKLVIDNIKEKEKMKYFLNCFKNNKRHSERTWLNNIDNEEVIVIENEIEASSELIEESKPKEKFRAKFFLFNENRRPGYYGTWRKKSNIVKPRRPFASDTKYFDYENDSDDEWEEDEPGESLNGSEDEKDKESEDDDYEVDNEFFVPHGYLSDEENREDDGELIPDNDDNSPETQKAKLKILQLEFFAEMKKKTQKIKPRLIGCVWQTSSGNQPETCPKILWDLLNDRSMLFDGSVSFKKPDIIIAKTSPSDDKTIQNGGGGGGARRSKLSDDEIKDLIELIHGNIHGKEFLIKEFRAYRLKKMNNSSEEQLKELSNKAIYLKIREIAKWNRCPELGQMHNKICWYVSADILKQYNLENVVTLPNKWNYILTTNRIEQKLTNETDSNIVVKSNETLENIEINDNKSEEKQNNNKIIIREKVTELKNNKLINDNDNKMMITPTASKILAAGTNDNKNIIISTNNSNKIIKKRVPILMSVKCNETVPENKKNQIISDFLKKTTNKDKNDDEMNKNEDNELKQTNTATVNVIKLD